MDIDTIWHCTLVRCTPSQSIGLFLCTLLWCRVSHCVPFTNSLITFYSCSIMKLNLATHIYNALCGDAVMMFMVDES